MRVLLIQTSEREGYGRMKGLVVAAVPLGILYIASAIREKRKDYVKILDLQVVDKPLDQLNILKEEWDVVGITAMSMMFKNARNIAEYIKKIHPDTITILGGSHATSAPFEDLEKANEFDYLVIGEGEETIVELLNTIEKNESITKLEGIAYWKDKLIKNPLRKLINDLDSLQFPAYDLVNINDYSHPVQLRKPMALMLTSRGCPGMCTFCSKSVFGRTLRLRSAKNVCDEIEMLIKNYGVKEIRFVDESFTVIKSHVDEVCKEIIKRKINIAWVCSLRADKNDLETFKLMKKAGCYAVNIGAESGNQDMLYCIKKMVTLQQIKETVERAHKTGLKTLTYFIIGFPNDTKETIMDTINFARSIKSDVVKFGIFTPLPGSELFNKLRSEKRLFHYDWNKYQFHNDPVYNLDYLTHKELFKLYKKAYFVVYTNPSMIWRNIKRTLSSFVTFRHNLHVGFTMVKMLLKKD